MAVALRLCLLAAVAGHVAASVIGDYVPSACTTCWQLQNCEVLNGHALPDTVLGYTRSSALCVQEFLNFRRNATSQLSKQGVCEDIDRAVTLLEVFGSAYQYKDTPTCRALIYRFNCLSWASKGNTCPNAPLPPCRSMCVEIADTCVFMPMYALYLAQVCGRFPCTTDTAVKSLCIDIVNLYRWQVLMSLMPASIGALSMTTI
uniref:Secreted protein n=1 Tax=Achlya hypogyna TaxID=1202772 RepID=A0A0A7CNY8_ACHHY|nr:secreted protein [Achlya hypogyna]